MINSHKLEPAYKRRTVLFALTLFMYCLMTALPAPAFADDVGWEEAWRVIRENNPGLKAVRQSVAGARATMKLSALPKKVTAALSGTAAKEEGDRSSSSAGISFSYNTSLSGRENAIIGAEKSAVKEAETLLKVATLDLYRNAAVSFWGAAAGEASVRAGEEEIDKRLAFLADAKLRFAQGMVPELDVMRAESALAEARHSLALLEAKRSGFAAMLKGLAGWMDISPAAGLFDPEEKISPRTSPPDFPSVVESHPSVRKAVLAVEKATFLARAAGMASTPSLSLTATRTLFTDGTASQQFTQDEWWGRATLSIPVIDGGLTRWTVARAQAGLASAEAALGAAKATVMMNLFSAWEDHIAAVRGLEAEQTRFALVSREREIVLLRYREGLANQIEVLDAQTKFADSMASLINARRDLLITEASLASAEGKIPVEEEE